MAFLWKTFSVEQEDFTVSLIKLFTLVGKYLTHYSLWFISGLDLSKHAQHGFSAQILKKKFPDHNVHLVKYFLHELKKGTNKYIPRFAQILCLLPQFTFFSILFEGQAPELSNKICKNLPSGWLQVQHIFLPLWLWVVQKEKNNSTQYPVAVYLMHNYEYTCIFNNYLWLYMHMQYVIYLYMYM